MPAKDTDQVPTNLGVSGLATVVLPTRPSLVDQAVEVMRGLISRQQWTDRLPGEEALRLQLGISRVTLRKALAELAAQGWIVHGGRGNRHLISPGVPPAWGARLAPGSVKCLSQFPEIDLVWSMRIIFDEIRRTLLTRGCGFEFAERPSAWRGNPAPQLRLLTAQPGISGWILYRASLRIQRWFQESRLACLVLGPCHEGISLPSVQVDDVALGRHLASEASRLGHHHVAFVMFDPSVASSLNSLQGIRQLKPQGDRPAKVTVISDDETVVGLRSALISVMAQPDPPTLVVVTEAVQALPVMGILREMNLRIPEDVSLVVRDHEPFLTRSVPEVTRYTFDWLRYGRTISRLLTDMIESGGVKVAQRKFLPVFIPGQTLARRRKG